MFFVQSQYVCILQGAVTANARFSAVHIPKINCCDLYHIQYGLWSVIYFHNSSPFSSSTPSAIFFVWFSHLHFILHNNFPRFLNSIEINHLFEDLGLLSNRVTDPWCEETCLPLKHWQSKTLNLGITTQKIRIINIHDGNLKSHINTFSCVISSCIFNHLLLTSLSLQLCISVHFNSKLMSFPSPTF